MGEQPSRGTMNALDTAAERTARGANAQNIANTTWAYAKLGVPRAPALIRPSLGTLEAGGSPLAPVEDSHDAPLGHRGRRSGRWTPRRCGPRAR